MSEQDITDANLLVVIAVDGYARRHRVSTVEAYKYLTRKSILLPDCALWAESADYIADDFERVA